MLSSSAPSLGYERKRSGCAQRIAGLLLFAAQACASQLTFTKDVAPILYDHCAPCHHDGGVAPFPLITYQDVHKHASQIAAVTRSRYMPPWPPEPGYGDFIGDRHLTDRQIRLIADWVEQGQSEGKPSDLLPIPHFNDGWQMGPPDLVVRMKKPFRMPAAGSDVFRNFVIATGLKETKYIRGFELRLDNRRVVHHANVVLDRTKSLRSRDGEDGKPGFPGMDVITEAAPNDFDPDSHFLFWKPGTVLRPEPDDMSWRLDPNTDLIVNLHLQPTGKEESVQAEIGLYFATQPPTRFPMLLQLEHDGAINIPPGDRAFEVTDHLTLPMDVDLLAIYPHAHYLGKLIEAWATLPNHSRRWLIRIPDWNINWQAVYEYKNPISLPKGTQVAMRITYDNSAENPRNPSNPPARVTTGNRSEDEMGHVWLQVLPKTPEISGKDARFPLQEAVMRRRLEKYPGDFLAHYNLAALFQSEGKLDQAVLSYNDALRIEPSNVTARNGLGSAFLLQDRLPEAIQQFREILHDNPGYLNARYNLAHALAANGDLSGAEAEYTTFLQERPNDADAQAALGTVYFKERNFSAALVHFRTACALNPNNADTQANLGTLLAISGDLRSAIQAFEEALRIDPHHEAARANLALARARLAARP